MKRVVFLAGAFVAAFLAIQTTALAQVSGSRNLPACYNSGSSITIGLDLEVDEANKPNGVIIKEYVPIGWEVTSSNPSYDSFNEATGEVKWLFYGADVTDGGMDISYTINVPGDASGSYDFTGNILFNDASGDPVTLDMGGDAAISDICPARPRGGYITDNVIPAAQISQSTNGDGIITIHFKIKDPDADPCALNTFQYSVDGGDMWNAPANGDDSECLSSGWKDNNGSDYGSAPDFDSAQEYSLTFETKHQDVTGLDGTDQSDIQIRFTLNDGTYDSLLPVTSESFRVDNLSPTVAISYSEPDPYRDADTITVTATFTEANEIAATPQIAIDYAGDSDDVPPTDMTATGDNKVWTYDMDIPSGNDGTATITITGSDAEGNPVGTHTENTFTVDNTAPTIQSYPSIDYTSNTIEVTYSESNMQNATQEANYSFSPSLNFTTLGGSDDITNPSGGTYRLAMSSIPVHTILTLTVSNITDGAGNPVSPSSIKINDNDGDYMADDWETYYGVENPNEDPDNDGLTNKQEFDYGTEPKNSDTDGDVLPDGWEVDNGFNPLNGDENSNGISDGLDDFDNDGWTNYEEYVNGYDPNDDNDPEPTPPEVVEVNPHDGAGINPDTTRVPKNASFAIRIEDSDGVDITNTSSIKFTINDSVNPGYERDLSDTVVVRVVKLTEDEDTQVTKLWAVYDRPKEIELGNYRYDTDVNIKVDAKDIRGDWMTQASYDFNIETKQEHDHAIANLPDTDPVAPDDPALGGAYDTGTQVRSGDLEGAKIVYDSTEVVTPTFGPMDELAPLDVTEVEAVGISMNLQPPTVFNTPVKVFIPCPGYPDVSSLCIYLYNGTSWVLACDASGNVHSGGEGCIVPESRTNHNSDILSRIEVQFYHFTGVQAGDSENQAPTASFTATPTSGEAPLRVIFDASDSNDPDGTIDSYAWDFGDDSTGLAELTSHEYISDGTYTVTLTVTDDDGATDTATATISVTAPAQRDDNKNVFGCFIATATFRSAMEPHVKVLREFRDRFLLSNSAGEASVGLYYTYSPPVGNFIARHDILRGAMRWSLLPVVGMSWVALCFGPWATLALLVLLVGLVGTGARVGLRRRRVKHQA